MNAPLLIGRELSSLTADELADLLRLCNFTPLPWKDLDEEQVGDDVSYAGGMFEILPSRGDLRLHKTLAIGYSLAGKSILAAGGNMSQGEEPEWMEHVLEIEVGAAFGDRHYPLNPVETVKWFLDRGWRWAT
jgi:hypothetical protein